MSEDSICEIAQLLKDHSRYSAKNRLNLLILNGKIDITKLPHTVRQTDYDLFYDFAFRRARGLRQHEYFQQLAAILEQDMVLEKDAQQKEALKDLVNTFEFYRESFDPVVIPTQA